MYQLQYPNNNSTEFARIAGRTVTPLRGASAAHAGCSLPCGLKGVDLTGPPLGPNARLGGLTTPNRALWIDSHLVGGTPQRRPRRTEKPNRTECILA